MKNEKEPKKKSKAEKNAGVNVLKAPGELRRPIKKKVFEKRFLKYIEHPSDRSFFESWFELNEEKYRIREGLGKDDAKKLKLLLAVIKRNRKGPVNLVPLAFAGIVIAGLVVFFSIFANPLLGRAMEKGLEAIFEARADVHNFRISLIRFRVAIGGITVANRDSPMKNLFQMDRTEIRLKPAAVLRGKIYIEEIRADVIRFGTDRTVSGALPERPPRVKKEKPKSDAPPLVDLKNFDAMALLNREYDKLNTPKLYDTAIAAYNESLVKWQAQVDLAKTKAAELQAAAQPIINLNVNNLRDMETITKTITDINTMVTAVQTAAGDAAGMVSGIETDIKTARDLEQNARTAITGDINHLKSYIDLNSGAAFSALEPSIREVLSDTAGQYLDYGLRALEVFEKLKAQAAAKPKNETPKKAPRTVFKGRDVIFPVKAYPAFYIGILASDFTLNTWNWAFDLRDISSNPDLTGKPVSLQFGLTESGGSLERQVRFEGNADFRTSPADRFGAKLNGQGFPVNLGSQLHQAGINGFTGTTAFSLNMTGHTDGGVSGGGDVLISSARLVDPAGTLAQAVDTAVREAGKINLGIQYTHRLNEADEFKITTNIAELVKKALESTVKAYAQKAMDEIEKALRTRINQYIDGRFVSKEELDTLFRVARGDKAAVDELKNSLDKKKTELEQKVKAAADQAMQEAKDEAKRQLEQAAQDVKQGNTPSLQTPNLPSLPGGGGLKLPGR
ncbi:MAG: hypothetical protein LBD48_11945 [Treponema sp.]|jgi:uncharacterized protein (TIGR03545 family)|nr:hypothetical protein [Treponema sp.]